MYIKTVKDKLLLKKVRDHYYEAANQARTVNGRGMLVEGSINYWPPKPWSDNPYVGRFDSTIRTDPIHPHTRELLSIESVEANAQEVYDSVIIDFIDHSKLLKKARCHGFPRTMDDPVNYSDEVMIIVLSGAASYQFRDMNNGKEWPVKLDAGTVLYLYGNERQNLERRIPSHDRTTDTIILSARKIRTNGQ